MQERTLGETQLFVLPSTSPANAAVPWAERLRWFRELAGRASGLPKRQSIRALVVDDAGRTLLFRYGNDYGFWWVSPGGGQEPGETDEQTLRRELAGGVRARGLRARPAALGGGRLQPGGARPRRLGAPRLSRARAGVRERAAARPERGGLARGALVHARGAGRGADEARGSGGALEAATGRAGCSRVSFASGS